MAATFDKSELYESNGLVAVVTGGGTGIGAIIARTLASNGAKKVYITGRRIEKLQEVAASAKGGNIVPVQSSVNSHDDLQRMVDQITQEVGYIDVLVNNAGQTTWDGRPDARPPPGPESSAEEVRDYYFNYRSYETWTQCLDTNVAAVFATSMAFLVLLTEGNKRREKGLPSSQIITIGSVGGMTRSQASYIYSASKAGVQHLMKNLGNTFIPFNVRTNVIAPGWFPSEMTIPVSKRFEHTGGVLPRAMVPEERFGKEEEMAGTILYLVSKAGGYCNGNVMVIDGGFLQNHTGP